jgi:hypothetical protein
LKATQIAIWQRTSTIPQMISGEYNLVTSLERKRLFNQLASGHSAIYTLSEENFFLAPTEPPMGSENQKIHCFEELQIKANSRMSPTHPNNIDAPTTIQRNSPSSTQRRAQRGDYPVGICTREKI